MGYDMCRISSDYLPCNGPGRMMALEYDDDRSLALATWNRSPLLSWSAEPVTWDTLQGQAFRDENALATWIDGLVLEYRPNVLTLVGKGASSPILGKAIVRSVAAPLLVEKPGAIPPENAMELGAAQATKELVDRQVDDCLESNECEAIRQKANKLVGPFRLENVAIIDTTQPQPLHGDL